MSIHPAIAEELVRMHQQDLNRKSDPRRLHPQAAPRPIRWMYRRWIARLGALFADSRDGRDWQPRADWQPLEDLRQARAATHLSMQARRDSS